MHVDRYPARIIVVTCNSASEQRNGDPDTHFDHRDQDKTDRLRRILEHWQPRDRRRLFEHLEEENLSRKL